MSAQPVRSLGPVTQVDFQCRAEWCWAAVTVSVLRLAPWRPQLSQGELAYRCINAQYPNRVTLADCMDGCSSGSYGPGNIAWPPELALQEAGIHGPDCGRPISPEEIEVELSATPPRPVCIQIRWDPPGQAGAHLVAIVGLKRFASGAVLLDVSDPLFGPGLLVWSADGRGYKDHSGTWVATYKTAF